jgi:hypothetical protein
MLAAAPALLGDGLDLGEIDRQSIRALPVIARVSSDRGSMLPFSDASER